MFNAFSPSFTWSSSRGAGTIRSERLFGLPPTDFRTATRFVFLDEIFKY